MAVFTDFSLWAVDLGSDTFTFSTFVDGAGIIVFAIDWHEDTADVGFTAVGSARVIIHTGVDRRVDTAEFGLADVGCTGSALKAR